jgi:hypothetical protein
MLEILLIVEFFQIKTFKLESCLFFMLGEKKEDKKTYRYLITITGSNTHFEVPINNLNDFEDLEKLLKILKKKL